MGVVNRHIVRIHNRHAHTPSSYTFLYSKSGSPTFSISGIVHFRSNALARTILKIYPVSRGQCQEVGSFTFCTLILWLVLLKIKLAFIALANRLAWGVSRSNMLAE